MRHALPVALQFFEELWPGAAFFSVCFINRRLKVSFEVRWKANCGTIIICKYGHDGAVWQGNALQDDLSFSHSANRDSHGCMVPERAVPSAFCAA